MVLLAYLALNIKAGLIAARRLLLRALILELIYLWACVQLSRLASRSITPPVGGITFAAQDSSTVTVEVKTNCRKVNCAASGPATLWKTQYKTPGSNSYVDISAQDMQDWGASDEYGIKFYIKAAGDNTSTNVKTGAIVISSVDNSSIALRINVQQAAATESFAVSPLVINFESNGTVSSGYSNTISVSSNAAWTVEVSD